MKSFANSDNKFRDEAATMASRRAADGLDALIGPLCGVIINVEASKHGLALAELLSTTGMAPVCAFGDADIQTVVLRQAGSPDILVRTRDTAEKNPFQVVNVFPKSGGMPNTRLETFVFSTPDLARLVEIQRSHNTRFQTPAPVRLPGALFQQTMPSKYTGNSIGYVQWLGEPGNWQDGETLPLPSKPALPYLRQVGLLDHAATRVRAEDRDPAILEFMRLTAYDFTMAIYVEELNSITNVARRAGAEFAMVFTSGVSPYLNDIESGPTEKFVHNYGPRVHHLAFRTEEIVETVATLEKNGMRFMSPLAGSPDEGLRQVFSEMSPSTLLVTEYIQRYGGFDGFFTRSNVAILTEATGRQ
jgi:hypothetical protein